MRSWLVSSSLLAALCLAGCSTGLPEGDPDVPTRYLGVETRLLDDELVNFLVRMEGAASAADVEEYARCAAAQYTLIRGFGFARHVRTQVELEGSIWTADAIYTVSAALPAGANPIDGEVTVAACTERGIPTV